MEARLTKIDTKLEYLEPGVAEVDMRELRVDMRELRDEFRAMRREHHSDCMLLLGAIFTVALELASLMAKGFNWL
jgi:hypothetical protein